MLVIVARPAGAVPVVGAAILCTGADGLRRVLAAQRNRPRTLAGWWEFPGGKVEPGETDAEALVRECREELRCEVAVGSRLGEVPVADGRAVLRVYLAAVVRGVPHPLEHAALRWLAAAELGGVAWLPADEPLLEPLRRVLAG
jgi:8-oxo-dGTP diphosphatase